MKTFEEIYSKVCIVSRNRLKEAKRRNNKFILVILVVEIIINLFMYFFISYIYVGLTFSLSVCLLVLLIVNARKNYSDLYKKCVIESLVKEYNERLNFNSKIGISKLDYLVSKFDKNFSEFFSEDRIYGNLRNNAQVQLSEIASYDVQSYKNSDGTINQSRIETFRGMYGVVKLEKSINGIIDIARNNNFRKFDNDRIEIDSAEFEQYYDCFSDNKVMAMQIFTSDLIEKYVDIANITDYSFELRIVDNNIYFRYKCGQMFEPPSFRDGLDEKVIRKYYMLIFYPMEILEKTVENIYSILEIN